MTFFPYLLCLSSLKDFALLLRNGKLMSRYTLCICSHFEGRVELFRDLIGDINFSRIVLSNSNPAIEFNSVKQSGEKLVLLVLGPLGHDAIKFLCDDYKKTTEERRTKWIHSISAGVDWYRLKELQAEINGIPFTNGRGGFTSVLAEHVIYSMLYFNRKTWRLLASRAEHKWDPFNMIELRGQKMGILGYGDIGQATAKLAVAMGMEVTGVKRSAPTANVDELGVHVVHGDAERDRVIRESDFVVNILPGTEETKEFFNKERFAMMKPSAIFINIGRGITQNEVDLVMALRNGVIAGAAVDVFAEEPLPADSPIWEIDNDKILVTNHSAFLSDGFKIKVAEWFVKCLKEFGTPEFEARCIRV
ncbi:putative D-isomer specific 2-hydroxyacid dehydrogenase-protein [Trypanosoma theileri]|uniref:Putative D-isomer specific 2-hydroxyacid dehydrogenase-protein n=1 Tax=Trypanosoma theileri TaxID=67003 RepID=A0A1X0PAE4_9TRYP|nr:putative D-isomer specific 2-hydroxyacid dehydrogenase-protein [Trypanosoma theileri]ORC93559.1 putative D-isomer specific 2-hydroxyacid dehydrogenase-protein [Trypanosoma theileri]